jgi:hypothetical protein
MALDRNAPPQKPRAGQIIRLFSARAAGAAAGERAAEGERNTRAALVINPQQILTGDIIDTANMVRTAPLWGLRTRIHLMHDGLSLTVDDAIRRHSGQAEKVKLNYVHVLTQQQREQLLAFLNSL